MSQGKGKKRIGQGVLGILCKLQNFVVPKAKHLCLHLSCKPNMCDSFSFIPDLVSSGSSGSVKSREQCYSS